jgi:CheY-like chemotaxis protein
MEPMVMPPQQTQRILVIDDEEPVRTLLVRFLKLEGYLPTEAANGEEGIRVALRSPPDLVLCDLMMPKVDGFGVLARLRAEPSTAGIPFLFLTASADAEDARIAHLLGANDYLTKPFNLADLRDLIARRLAERTD